MRSFFIIFAPEILDTRLDAGQMSVYVGIRKNSRFPLGLDPVNFPLAGFSFKIYTS